MKLPPIPKNVNAGMFSIHMRSYFISELKIIDNQVVYQDIFIKDKKGNTVLVDEKSFRAISFGFFADKNQVFGLTQIIKSHSTTIALTPLQLDIDSFEVINLDYAKDKNNTYFADGAVVMKGTNYSILDKQTPRGTLNIIQLATATEIWNSDFILNEEHVFYRGKLVEHALPQNFRKLGSYWYKDTESVFFKDGLSISHFPQMDALTFLEISGYQATDKFKPIETALHNTAPESLLYKSVYKDFFEGSTEFSDYWYFKAKEKLKDITSKEIIPLAHGFSQIGNEIFYKNRPKDTELTRILNTDISNFTFLEFGYATNGTSLFLIRDENWSYYKSFREIEYNTKQPLEILSEAWVINGDIVIYKAFKKIKIDKESFKVLNHIYAYDKNGLICEGVRKKDILITKNVKAIGGVYLKIDDEFFYMGKSRNKTKIDDSRIFLINDFIIMGSDGSAFNHGKYRKYIGNFDTFKQLENGNYGDGVLEWNINYDGLNKV